MSSTKNDLDQEVNSIQKAFENLSFQGQHLFSNSEEEPSKTITGSNPPLNSNCNVKKKGIITRGKLLQMKLEIEPIFNVFKDGQKY